MAPLPEPEAEATVSLVRTKEGGRFLEVLEAAVAAAVLERFILLETGPPPPVGPVKFAAAECNAGFKMMVFPLVRSPFPFPVVMGCISRALSVVSHGSEVVFNFLI